MKETLSWDQMLQAFRAQGGIADNVEQRKGQYGNGLFPVDPSKPVRLHVPEHLLVDEEHIQRRGDALVLAEHAPVSDELRAFYESYQANFSWGAEGRKGAEAHEQGLRDLPTAVLTLLKKWRLLNLEQRQQVAWDEQVKQSFLQSRRISYKGRKVIMPIIELLNHGVRSGGYRIGEGITVEGLHTDEITVNYQPQSDALKRFLAWGFASQEPMAFSIPLNFEVSQGRRLLVGGQSTEGVIKNRMTLPKRRQESQRDVLSHVRIGSVGMPRLPRTLFRLALPDWPAAQADEVFERICAANLAMLTDLLMALQESDLPAVHALRQSVFYQLKAMSQCHGVRADLLSSNA
jgi:hypothetical protein